MIYLAQSAPMQGQTILFSEMTPQPEWAQRFHAWYDEEHIPNRNGLPGFLSAQRYQLQDQPSYLAIYEMDSPAALGSEGYRVLKDEPSQATAWMLQNVQGFTRYICQQISQTGGEAPAALDAAVLYAVWFAVPEDRCADFDAWYDQDHVPLLMKCPHWLMVRRFRVLSGDPGKYNRLALHYLSDMAAIDSPERAQARATPWRERLAAEPWFHGTYGLFTRHGVRQDLTA